MGFHPDFPADAKGLPKFWLHTLKNANEESLLGLIEPVDEPVLEYMTDLTIALHPDFKPTVDLKEMKLPAIMLGRVKALKNLQMNAVKVETEYYKEINKLDMKYQAKYEKHYQQMAKVISGAPEPAGDELEWIDDVEDVEQKEVD